MALLFGTMRQLHRLSAQDLMVQGQAQGYMAEALMGIATIKASGTEDRALHRWANRFTEHLNLSVRRDTLLGILSTVTGTIQSGTPLVLLWYGAQLVLQGQLSVGSMLALNTLALAVLSPLTSLVSTAQRLQLVRAHFERIDDVLETDPEQYDRTTQPPPHLTGHIELEQVGFRYASADPWAVEDITLTMQPGQKIAIVGQTGSGKSTLGKLLLGFYEPTLGTVRYDGLPLSDLDYREVRRQMGVVLQEMTLMSGSIRENIAFAHPEMSLEQVVIAAKRACLHDDIERMLMGYETSVGDGGSALSGGQRQRLAIARAIAAEPDILLFDEATSHLDVVTEQQLEAQLNALPCTRIVIAHRLSTIRDADCIYVMHHGRIVEHGTHEELLRRQGHYAQLVLSQEAGKPLIP